VPVVLTGTKSILEMMEGFYIAYNTLFASFFHEGVPKVKTVIEYKQLEMKLLESGMELD